MPVDSPQPNAETALRYTAFISYRHASADRKWAAWLHKTLETYRVPRALVERGFPRRIGRIFRDEEELSAASDLSARIDTALTQSHFLIVVCSPNTPQSRWVNAEVERFRSLGRADQILALLIEGQPAESFPKALCEIRSSVVREDGARVERIDTIEPLAADVRRSDDARRHTVRNARDRLVSTILGVSYDELRNREQQRRARRLAVAASTFLGLSVVMAALVVFALLQRADALGQKRAADEQRAVAERNASEARTSLAQAQRSVDALLGSVTDSALLHQPDLQPLRQKLLQDAVEIQRELSQGTFATPESQRAASRANSMLGSSLQKSKDMTGAIAAQREAVEPFLALVAANPQNLEYRRELGRQAVHLGKVLRDAGQLGEAEKWDRLSVEEQERLVAGPQARARDRLDLSQSYRELSKALRDAEKSAEAEQFARKSMETSGALAAANPRIAEYQREYAVALGAHADTVLRVSGGTGALEEAERGFILLNDLVATDVNTWSLRYDRAHGMGTVAQALTSLDKRGDALAWHREALAEWQALASARGQAVGAPASQAAKLDKFLERTRNAIVELSATTDLSGTADLSASGRVQLSGGTLVNLATGSAVNSAATTAQANPSASAATTQPIEPHHILATDAPALKSAVGRVTVVRGIVKNIGHSKSGSIAFIDFEGNNMVREAFTAMIREEHLAAVSAALGGDLLTVLPGKTVEMTGVISNYQGKPQMVLAMGRHIRIVAADAPPAAGAGDVVPASDTATLKTLVGKMVRVRGTVDGVNSSKSGAINFIHFQGATNRGDFVAIIRKDKMPAVSSGLSGDVAEVLRGKTVEVTGTLTAFKDAPQIEVESASQIRIPTE